MKVLLIERNDSMQALYERLLEDNYEILQAYTPEEAIRLFNEHLDIDVVVSGGSPSNSFFEKALQRENVVILAASYNIERLKAILAISDQIIEIDKVDVRKELDKISRSRNGRKTALA